MQDYIEQTIRNVEGRIAGLQGLVAGLRGLGAEGATTPVGESKGVGIRGHKVKDKAKGKVPRGAQMPGARARNAERAIAAGRGLSEPLTRVALAAASGLTLNGAGSALTRWVDKGWLKKTGYGQFARTAKYPNGAGDGGETPTPAAGRVHVPGLDPEPTSRGTLTAKLEEALGARDRARGAGQERLAKILQDKVDKLQRELGQMTD